MNKKTIKTILERIKFIKQKYGVEFGLDESDEKIYLETPEDNIFDEEGISVVEFLNYTESIKELIKIDNTSVRCGRFRQTIVYEGDTFVKCYPTLQIDEYKLSIVYQPFFIGIIALQEGYDKENPYSFYTAVELEYTGEKRMTEREESLLIKRYLYDVAAKLGYSVMIDTFHNWPDFTKEDESICKYKNQVLNINDIPPYTKAMDYYIEALESMNADIQFLSFYKVLEYFSPTVSRKAFYEKMNKRLDAISVIGRSYEDLNEVFELVNKYNTSLEDREIPNTILSNCVDIEPLLEFLPQWVRNKLGAENKTNKQKNNYDRFVDINSMLGSVLYSTRNRIVHAKTNFRSNGNECPEEYMEELNVFMNKLCQCIFVWNGRQADNYQLK